MGCSRYLGAKLNRAPIRKPLRIRPGDVVGVIAPAGAVDGERLSAGVAVLEGWGLRVQVGSAVLKRHAYLAGSDDERLADLVQVIEDPRVRAIFCARGGYGSQRLLPRLDFARLARQPKPIIGYSDATALLGAAVEAGVPAVHGTMAACPPVDGVGPLDVVRACVGDLPCPIAFGLPSGHAPGGARTENLALPFGVEVALDAERGRLTALEAAVV